MQLIKKRCITEQNENNEENKVLSFVQEEKQIGNKLSEVNLTSVGIRCLKGLNEIISVQDITVLWLSENPLKYLAGIQYYSNLEELNIDYCKI